MVLLPIEFELPRSFMMKEAKLNMQLDESSHVIDGVLRHPTILKNGKSLMPHM